MGTKNFQSIYIHKNIFLINLNVIAMYIVHTACIYILHIYVYKEKNCVSTKYNILSKSNATFRWYMAWTTYAWDINRTLMNIHTKFFWHFKYSLLWSNKLSFHQIYVPSSVKLKCEIFQYRITILFDRRSAKNKHQCIGLD